MKKTLFYQNVTVLDFAFFSKDKVVVGDAFKVNVFLTGKTNEEEMILDFSLVKKQIKFIIDDICDHRLVIPKDYVKQIGEDFVVDEESLYYKAPRQAYFLLENSEYSQEALASQLEQIILNEVPNNIEKVEISFESEEKNQAYFHYTHGLREHGGNCQRLFHGHRNTVRVFVDNERKTDLENWLSENEFNSNIHFCYWDNVQNKDAFEDISAKKIPIGRTSSSEMVHISYTSNQGFFEGKLPAREVYFMPTETTIENLSYNYAQIIKDYGNIQAPIEIWGFEGIGKGAKSTLA